MLENYFELFNTKYLNILIIRLVIFGLYLFVCYSIISIKLQGNNHRGSLTT